MLGAIARTLFGSANDRAIRAYRRTVQKINALEEETRELGDAALRDRTEEFRARLAKGETLNSLLPEAFATVREAARRTLGQRHFDVQLIGGMILHDGKIAEMKTGEGKTLVATLPVYLNALTGRGVHVVTVNDYLARRDSEWMGQIYRFLGLTTGCIVHGLTDQERREAYACDVTYATNNELGFDYLRDNMKFRISDMAQRPFHYAIVDEVDSILIDEARTPLIISGPAHDSSDLYAAVDRLMPLLKAEDYEKDEKLRTVTLTEEGQEKAEAWLREQGLLKHGGLYDLVNVSLVHHVNQALRAHKLFTRDVDYIIKDDAVVLIDEFTGRMTPGRRYSEGLHQALEAKESVTIQQENQTLASITFQNLFRIYEKLAGMTGTALTEAAEFGEIYKLDVVEVPTNVPVARKDHDDEVYRTAREKYNAIILEIVEAQARRQPVLVGTVSIEKSELLSAMLKERKIPHAVLNARYHEQEAMIVAQAGRPGAVTIATNMAGRGTDIQLGGNLEMRLRQELPQITDDAARVARRAEIEAEIQRDREAARAAGGLFVIGTERHESRRIDNQLRGRSGRQGDAGASKFFLSLEDDLMRIFGSQRMDGLLQRLGLQEGEAIVHTWINKAIQRAQTKVEAQHFEVRKNILKYDDVMNNQRKVIYDQRREIMTAEDVDAIVRDMRHEVIEGIVRRAVPPQAYPEQWDLDLLEAETTRVLGLDLPVRGWAAEDGIAGPELEERIRAASDEHMGGIRTRIGEDTMRTIERAVLLQVLDQDWKDHLLTLDHLRQGINLRAYAQRDPLNEYKREAFELFGQLLAHLRETVTSTLSRIPADIAAPPPELMRPAAPPAGVELRQDPHEGDYQEAPLPSIGAGAPRLFTPTPALGRRPGTSVDPADPATWGKVQRNAPCPCGSGRKFKHCHGRLAAGQAEASA